MKFTYCMAWIKGSWDYALMKQARIGEGPNNTFQFMDACIPMQVTMLQIAKIYVKHLDDHPEVLHIPPMITFNGSLRAAFPCK